MSEKPESACAPVLGRRHLPPERILVVRSGHGANCSSIGSVIDTLFVAALAGGAVFAAIAAAVSEEPIRAVTTPSRAPRDPEPPAAPAETRTGRP
jgi:hypothetical protein